MNETIVRKRKLFWSWQDDKQEAWLAEMSRQGLHLKKLGGFGKYLFVQGPSREYSYRLDFSYKKKKDDYFQFIRDAGWEHLGTLVGWQYWRKEARDGKAPELYTDPESKIRKYLRQFAFSVASVLAMSILFLVMFLGRRSQLPVWFIVFAIGLWCILISFEVITAIKILMRIRELRRLKPI